MIRYDNDSPLAALEELQRQLHRLGWQTRLHTDEQHPYLRISLDAAYREYVFVAQYDKPCYRWNHVLRAHPVGDPIGAAELTRDAAQPLWLGWTGWRAGPAAAEGINSEVTATTETLDCVSAAAG